MTEPTTPDWHRVGGAGWRELLPGQRSVVRVLDVVTGESQVVLETDEVVVEAPNWHPTRDELLVNADGALWRVPLDGSRPVPVETPANPEANNDHVISPDGATIYLSNRDGELRALAYEGGPAVRVSNAHDTPFRHYLHGVSPDGATLLYIGHDARPEENTFEVYALHLPTSTDTRLTVTGRHHDGCEFDAAGERIWFNSERASTRVGHSQLFSMAADGSDVRQMTTDERVNWFPHESPDGTRVVYLSYPVGTVGHPPNLDVELRTLDERGEPVTLRRLHGGQGTVNVNSWAPDSRRIAFVEYPVPAGDEAAADAGR